MQNTLSSSSTAAQAAKPQGPINTNANAPTGKATQNGNANSAEVDLSVEMVDLKSEEIEARDNFDQGLKAFASGEPDALDEAEEVDAPVSNQDLISGLYDDVLGREGDEAGVEFWTKQLDDGTMTFDQVQRAFRKSTERSSDGVVKVALIDAFDGNEHPDSSYYDSGRSHGGDMEDVLADQGVEFDRFEVTTEEGGSTSIGQLADQLDNVIAALEEGTDYDAVNLSWGAHLVEGEDVTRLQESIQYIQDEWGIPVSVAAGNETWMMNSLAETSLFEVENTYYGSDSVAPNSADGNIRAEGNWTSDATALLSARAAILEEGGFSNNELQEFLELQASYEGGKRCVAHGLQESCSRQRLKSVASPASLCSQSDPEFFFQMATRSQPPQRLYASGASISG